MSTAITVCTVIGTVVGAAFVLAGGLLLPLWQITEERHESEGVVR